MKNLMKFLAAATLTIGLLLLSSKTNGQSIDTREVDAFTKDTVCYTNWERLNYTVGLTVNYRFKRVDNRDNGIYRFVMLEMKVLTAGSKGIYIADGSKFLLKGVNDDIFTLESTVFNYVGSTCFGYSCSSTYFVRYVSKVTNWQNIDLIFKWRMITTEGYIERDIDKQQREVFVKCIDLIHRNYILPTKKK